MNAIMMIFITADPHGEFEGIAEFCEKNKTTKDDIMIILGDAGINYHLNSKDSILKAKLAEIPITFFCIHGNHEERPERLYGYKEKMWNGGVVYAEDAFPDLLFAKDGEIFDFGGKKAIVIGGAYSVDKYYRLYNKKPWFSSEQPDEKIKKYVEEQLEKCNWKVDYVFSHTAPLKYEPTEHFLSFINQKEVDKTTEEWLDKIEDKLSYERWYVGHYHCDKCIDKVKILYWDIEKLM